MPRTTIRALRAAGVPQEDIDMARATQDAQRRTGAPVQSLAAICGIERPRHAGARRAAHVISPDELLDRQRRRLGAYAQAALMADRQALAERSGERAQKARAASKALKELDAAVQLEFDFFGGGNVSIAFQYQDAVTERLFAAAPTAAKANLALSILWAICRHLGWQSYECSRTASQLCEITRTDPAHMARSLSLLEEVGAIRRVRRGRVKVITVTPEGAFRGNVNGHGQAVERYRLEVIDGGKADGDG